MKGSEKQIKWAESIRDNMDFDSIISQVTNNENAVKTINFIRNIDHATFWIDNKKNTPTDMLRRICGSGLPVRGDGFSHTATVDQETGKITITWTEIVSDGKGGHHETKTKFGG